MDGSIPTSGPGVAAAPAPPGRGRVALWAVVAAFGTYACMYGLRKPFTAAGYGGGEFPPGFKAWLITSQVLGYTLSKFVGIPVIAGMPPRRRAGVLVGLVCLAQVPLVAFGFLPPSVSWACLFLNGLPLGMVFGLVLGFLEGRRMTEALVAGLCASFIVADGLAKSAGAVLLERGVPEHWMPAAAGLVFLPPLLGFVWMLSRIPPPDPRDVHTRAPRTPMSRGDRVRWLRRHGMGIGWIIVGYLLVTILRSLRADFAPELWNALGSDGRPGIFTRSELWVALAVVAANGTASLVEDHRRSFLLAIGLCVGGLLLGLAAVAGQRAGHLDAFPFMVLLGLGLYLPYVAVHTTLFERLIAMNRDPGNIGYLMYLADAFGYLGYVGVMATRLVVRPDGGFLGFFQATAAATLGVAVLSFLLAAGSILRGGTGSPGHPARPDPGPQPAG